MARPVGTKATKDNSRKLHANREEWTKGKKLGRPRQAWVWDVKPTMAGDVIMERGRGHWTKA